MPSHITGESLTGSTKIVAVVMLTLKGPVIGSDNDVLT